MQIDIAVVLESSGNRHAGGEGSPVAVYKDVDQLLLVLGEFTVNGQVVEVMASELAFE